MVFVFEIPLNTSRTHIIQYFKIFMYKPNAIKIWMDVSYLHLGDISWYVNVTDIFIFV